MREATVYQNATAYLRIVAVGEPMVYLSAAVSGGFNGAGRSGLAFFANAAGLVINMILDPLMITVWGWGVPGAAIATLIAQSIVCLAMVLAAKRHPRRPFSRYRVLGALSLPYVKRIFRWSLPMALESGAFTALAMVVAGMISARFGANAVAVQRVGSQIESLSWLVGGGFSSAVTAFVGQNYGARKWARIRRGYRVSMAVLMGWELLVTVLLATRGRALYSLFLREPLLIRMGGEYLLILAVCQPFMALEGICGGTFRGIGKTLPPSISSITSHLIRPGLCYLLAQFMGLNGFWLGVSLSAAMRGLLMFIWYSFYQRKMPRQDGEEIPSRSPLPA